MDLKKRKEKKNSSISAFIIAGVFLVLALAFIPLTFIEGVFNPKCVESIFMYCLFIVFAAFLTYAIVQLILYLKKDNKE